MTEDASSPALSPAEQAGAEAKQFMADNWKVYTDKSHPKHAATDAEVKRLFKVALPDAPPAEPRPPPAGPSPEEAWRTHFEDLEPGMLPQPTPESIRAIVPASADQYEFALPGGLGEGQWDKGAVQQFLTEAATPGKLSNGQVEDLLRAYSVYVHPRLAAPGGPENLKDPHFLEGMSKWFAQHKIRFEQGKALVEWFDAWADANAARFQASPDPAPDPEAEDVRALMSDRQGPYYDRTHPRHRSTLAKVRAYFARVSGGATVEDS